MDIYEGGLQLQVDVAHRVLRTETVRDIFVNLQKRSAGSFQNEAEKALLGATVITRYNNKSYKIDGIEFKVTIIFFLFDREQRSKVLKEALLFLLLLLLLFFFLAWKHVQKMLQM